MSRTTYDVAPDPGAIEALLRGRLDDPFSVLGPHRGKTGTVIRTFQPGATSVEVHPVQKDESNEPLQSLHPSGVFGGEVIDPATTSCGCNGRKRCKKPRIPIPSALC